jgi:hypothetical protein
LSGKFIGINYIDEKELADFETSKDAQSILKKALIPGD